MSVNLWSASGSRRNNFQWSAQKNTDLDDKKNNTSAFPIPKRRQIFFYRTLKEALDDTVHPRKQKKSTET